MTLSLHSVLVPAWLQILGASHGWLDKAAASGIAESELLDKRLIEDMLPFAAQIKAMNVHSKGAVEAVQKGAFVPQFREPNPTSIAGLRATIDEAESFVKQLAPAELDSLAEKDVLFQIGEKRLDFTAEGFLLSFSLPNFFFHSTTAYDILRMHGLDIGKVNFMGKLRLKQG